MVTKALLLRLEAKRGKEAEVEQFLNDGLPIVQEEAATVAWFGIRMGPSTFGIFDVFPDEAGRQAHLSGRVAQALTEKASELFAEPPAIERIDVLASKLPEPQEATAGSVGGSAGGRR
ncbi:MAG: antibiotic biosynthesis monooxygenase [Gemmatimonadales bacterium]|nr:antibiotic biosynthesis monooxygenase [Gemmatimonadales bacterium]